jgi:PhoPQ-activated pathogenicity-related protein
MLGSYTQPGLPRALGTGGGQRLLEMVDPYSYRARLSTPKLIVLGTNDRYWSLDALNLYWNELPGIKRVLYVPNAGHGLPDAGWEDTLVCFFRHVAVNTLIPELASRRVRDGNRLLFTVDGQPNPSMGQLWYAYSPSRDFRAAKWRVKPADPSAGQLGADVPLSADQFTAAFIDAQYDDGWGPCRFSSQIAIEAPQAMKP